MTMFNNYFPTFASSGSQTLPSSGDTSFPTPSTSNISTNEDTYVDIPAEESLQRIFLDEFSSIELTRSPTVTKGVSSVYVEEVSSHDDDDDDFVDVNKIIRHINEDQYGADNNIDEIETINRDDVPKIDENQSAGREIDKKEKCFIENKTSRCNKAIQFSKIQYFPEYSYLHRIEGHIVKCVSEQIPELLVGDILRAKKYNIFDKLRSDILYEVEGFVFNNLKCRATVVGISHGNTESEFIVSDGTGSVRCVFDENISETKGSSSIIVDFATDILCCETVISPYNLRRGQIVQIMGYLEVRYNKIRMVGTRLCREDRVDIRRELEYLFYLEKLAPTLTKWKRNVEKILIY